MAVSASASSDIGVRGSDFALLSREVKAAGLLERRRFDALRGVVVPAALSGAVVLLFLWVGRSWWQLLVAPLFGFVLGQLAFVGHDAGHHQVFRGARANRALGLLHANVLVGLSFGWWNAKHNRHHGNPNAIDRDPDIGDGVIVWTPAQMARRAGLVRRLTRHQARYFFPLLMLEGLSLKVASVRALPERGGRRRLVELVLLVLHFAGRVLTVCFVLSWPQAVLFCAIEELAFGAYLGCSFAPNHIGMTVTAGDPSADFLRKQVLTARNLRGGRLTSFFYGGLNHQIEHHLFPSMPRHRLRRAAPLVRQFCQRHAVAYHETGVWESYRQIVGALRLAASTAP
ncbi:MAG TPA: acyl-CoA desaturase [Mycobacteriales bacterium]|nr:acyl-CoA desaturase [Mycobacteriales bacterium]